MVGLLFVPAIQTFAVNKLTQNISEKWGTEISMKDVHVTPSLKLVVHDFRIQDNHHKDMIFVGTVKGRLLSFSLKPIRLKFGNINLDKADVVIRKYAGERSVNIAIWAEKFKKEKKVKNTFLMTAKKLQLTHSRFVLINDDRRVVFDTKNNPDIDYGYFELADIDWKSENFKVSAKDIVTIVTNFKHLAFEQYGGFNMTDCQGDFSICDTALVFDKLKFKTPNSRMDMDLKFAYSDWKKLGDFVDSVRIISTIRPSNLCMKDVAGFVPSLKGMDETIALKASRFNGPVNNFSIIGLAANWGFGTRINGDFALKDITDFKNAKINVQLDSSQVSIPELAAFTLPKGKTIPINKTISKLGITTLKGSFIGTPTVFDAKLDASTGIGTVFANLSTFTENGGLQLNGTVSSPNLNIAKFTNNQKILGSADLFVAFEGGMKNDGLNKENLKTLSGHLSGDINRIRLFGYNLKNTNIEADYNNRLYNCELTSKDNHLQCNINGQLDLREEVPLLQSSIELDHFDAGYIASSLEKIDSATAKGLDKILLSIQKNPDMEIGFDNFMVALRGSNLDNVNGYIGCDNIRIFNGDDSLTNERFRFTAINTDIAHKFIFSSNVANISLETNYAVKNIKDSLLSIGHSYFPTLIANKNTSKRNSEILSDNVPGYIKAHINTYRTRSVLRMLLPNLYIASNSTVDASLSTSRSDDNITADIPFFIIRDKVRVHNLKINGEKVAQGSLDLDIATDSVVTIIKNSNFTFDDISLKANTQQDTILYHLNWRNQVNENLTDESSMSGFVDIANTNDIVVALRNSTLYLNEQKWQFNNENDIHIKKDAIVINNLCLSDSISKIEANGTYSKSSRDLLHVNISDLDMALLNPFLSKMSCDGDLSANVNISNRNGKMFLFGKALANDFNFNEEKIGNVFLMAVLDTTNKVTFNGGIFDAHEKMDSKALEKYSILSFLKEKQILAKVNGNYDQKRFAVHTQFDSLSTGFLSPFLSGFSDHIDGKASGNLDFYATPDSSYFDGTVHVDDVNMGIQSLGMNYTVQDQNIFFNSKGIFFDRMLIKDPDGNTAFMSGAVRHKMFKDMDIDLSITTDRAMVLNTPKEVNSVFFGVGYVSGDVTIKGDQNNLVFKGSNLTTLSGTKIYLQVNSANSASQSDIITFKPKVVEQNNQMELNQMVAAHESKTALNFDFTFNVTNEADVVLLLESIGGTMNARADGRFQLTYNNNDNLNLYGLLQLHSGDFRLSLYNVVNSKFTLVPGGSILFDGPLENMLVNASAYKSSKTSLSNIVPQEYLSGNSANVNAFLHLNGQLMKNIEPTFSFELPNSSNEVRNMFYTAIDTANTENITKQFVYFMVTNNFMPNDMFSSDRSGSDLGASGLNLFSNIVNNMFNNMFDSKNGSFGLTYNQATETSSAEYGVKAGANILNDRVNLETSIGYYDDKNTQGFNNMYGDFSVEYNINKAGTWKLKAYTYIGERDENYIYDAQINYTAGVALAFKQDFDSPRRKNKSNKNRKKQQKNEQH